MTAELTFLAVRAHARRIDITDPHQLAAHHLRERGALRQILTDGTSLLWLQLERTPGPERRAERPVVRAGQGLSNDVLTLPHPAQWRSTEPGGDSLVIWTGTRPDGGGIVIHLPGHAPVPVPDEELWALLDLAPLVTDAGVDVPVVFPMGGFTAGDTRRTQPFTDRTGRSAFGYSGPLDLVEDDPFDPLRITALREKKLGQWVRTVWRPRPAPGAAPGTPGTAAKTGPSPSGTERADAASPRGPVRPRSPPVSRSPQRPPFPTTRTGRSGTASPCSARASGASGRTPSSSTALPSPCARRRGRANGPWTPCCSPYARWRAAHRLAR